MRLSRKRSCGIFDALVHIWSTYFHDLWHSWEEKGWCETFGVNYDNASVADSLHWQLLKLPGLITATYAYKRIHQKCDLVYR